MGRLIAGAINGSRAELKQGVERHSLRPHRVVYTIVGDHEKGVIIAPGLITQNDVDLNRVGGIDVKAITDAKLAIVLAVKWTNDIPLTIRPGHFLRVIEDRP
jgi:hypothetical protein